MRKFGQVGPHTIKIKSLQSEPKEHPKKITLRSTGRLQQCWDGLSRRSTGCTHRTQLWRGMDTLPLLKALLCSSLAAS